MGQIDRLSENIQVASRIMSSHAVFRRHAVPEPLRFADQLPGPFQMGGIGAGIAAGATDLGFAVAPAAARAPHLIGLGLDATGLDPAALAARLADDRVHVSVRGTSVRVSAHRFNDDGDVDRLLASLARAVGR